MSASRRVGLTLLELLVVLGIIAVLSGLTLAVIQKVRAAAAQSQCQNNLRQIGLAVSQYHDQHKAMPPGMRLTRKIRHSSWLAQLLPFLDQQPLWAATEDAYRQSPSPFRHNPPHVGLTTVIPVFVCPLDSRAGQVQLSQRENISVALTCYLGVSGLDLTTKDGIFFRNSRVRLADISDGSSNTLLAGERPPSPDFQYGWWYAGSGQRGSGSGDMLLGVFERNALPVTRGSCAPGSYPYSGGDLQNQCDMFHFWSLHSGGANFVFADGSVRFLNYGGASMMPALASRASGEVVELP